MNATVILVHGIGNFPAGSALNPAVSSIRKEFPKVDVAEPTNNYQDSQTCILKYQDKRLELVEFHWSGVAGKIRDRNPFTALKRLLTLFWDLPRLGLWQTSSRRQAWFSNSVGGLLVFAALVHIVFLIAFGFESQVWPAQTGVQTGSILDKLSSETTLLGYVWVILLQFCFYLFAIAGIAAWSLRVNRERSAWFTIWTGVFTANIVYAFYFLLMAVTLIGVNAIWSTWLESLPMGIASFLFGGVFAALLVAVILIIPQMKIADLLRDVVHYFAPATDGRDHPHTRETKARLRTLLDQLANDGVAHVVVVAHSLGTVIATEVLRECGDLKTHSPLQIDLVTCGSPLKRSLRGLLPRRVPSVADIFLKFKNQSSWTFGTWLNAYRVFDSVGKSLGDVKVSMSHPDRIARAAENHVVNILLSPWFKPRYGHGNYWQDSRFLHLVFANIIRPILEENGE